MTDRHSSIYDLVEDWKRRQTPRKEKRGSGVYFKLQAVIIMLAVFSLYHYPPVIALPHADVLILDMTHSSNDASRGLFTDLLTQSHLSWILYDSVTVNLVRLIPTGGYHVIILWGHSGINDMATTELYTPFAHVLEQLTGEVGRYLVQGRQYFSIEPGLVSSMTGKLHGSLVLLMGCNTLTQPELAQAFVNKGSSMVVGWKGLVSLSVTDMFAISLFQKVLQEDKPIGQAILETNGILGTMGLSNLLYTLPAP